MSEDLKLKVIDAIDSLIPKGQNSLDMRTSDMVYGINKAKEAVLKLFAESSTQSNDSKVFNALDCISRQTILDAIDEIESEVVDGDGFQYEKWRQFFCELPSAESEEFEWCTGCKEYDQEAHCCHRWTKAIRNTVEEIKNAQPEPRWIPCERELPELASYVLVSHVGSVFVDCLTMENGDLFFWEAGVFLAEEIQNLAWMPLPEPWKGESDA